MRTAGKRPKALRARRIRPQDRRFVPVLMDRSPPARQPAPRSDLPFPPPASVQASCGDFQETLPASSQPGHLQKIFFNPSGHSLARHTPLHPCKRRVQATSKRAFPSHPDTAARPPRIEPRLPLSSPLVKQRGAAPPASCRQTPHELRPLPQRQIPQNALPLRQYPSPQHNPRQYQDLIRITTGNGATRGPPCAPGCPGMVDEREQQLLRGPSRSGGSPPANSLALTRTKVFAGMGARGKGSLFQKASLPPDGPLSSNNKTGPSSLPPPPLLRPLAFRAQIGQRCGQQKEMA